MFFEKVPFQIFVHTNRVRSIYFELGTKPSILEEIDLFIYVNTVIYDTDCRPIPPAFPLLLEQFITVSD